MTKKISSKYYSTDWSSDLGDRFSPKWTKGIEIIKDRFESRFLKPVEALIGHENKEIRGNAGFVTMSIDCLLIETLNQFYLGLKSTNDKYAIKNKDINYKFNWQAFRDFFSYSIYFPDFKENDNLTKVFFNEIRCGLLHQAESKTNSLINLKNNKIALPIDSENYSSGIIINRNLFHEALRNEFDKYILDLANPESKNVFGEYLRVNCNAKMTHLCK